MEAASSGRTVELHLGITAKLTLVFVLFAAVLLLGLGLFAYTSGRAALREAAVSQLDAIAAEKQAALETWAADRRTEVAALAASPALLEELAALDGQAEDQSTAAHDRIVELLEQRTGPGQPYLTLMVIEPREGKVIASTEPREEGTFKEDRPFFLQGQRGPYIQNPYYAISLSRIAMTASAPLRAADGRLLGVLAGRLNLDEMNVIVARGALGYESDDIFLVNTSNLFVTQPQLVTDPVVLQRGIHTEAVTRCLAPGSGSVLADDYRGVPVIAVYRWLPERGLCLLAKIDQAEAFAPARAFGLAVLLAGGLALVAASLLGASLARTITRPVLALQGGAARFGRGDLGVRLPESSRDELGLLAHEFNAMAAAIGEKEAQLRDYAARLEQKVEERTAALTAALSRLRRLVDANIVGVAVAGEAGEVFEANDYYLSLLGFTREELQAGQVRWTDMTPPEHLPADERALAQLHQMGVCTPYEKAYCRKDGSRVWVIIAEALLPDEDGKIIALVQDITERKQAEERLAYQAELLANVNDAIIASDEQYRLTAWNRAAETMYGWRAEEVLGRMGIEILQTEFPGTDPAEMRRMIAETGGWRGEATQLRRDGTRLPVEVASIVLRGAGGRLRGYVSVNRDITERKRAEELLLRQAEELRRSNAELQQFAYVASHDLQEPLRMVSSFTQLLARRYRGRLDADADDFIAYAVDGANRLQTLINDLLAYSRVGRQGPALELVDCDAVVDRAIESLQMAIAESGATVTHDPLPTVRADASQLVQVFLNLIGNAVKYRSAEPPQIHVSAERGAAEWIFSVCDNGIGVEPQYAERIFIIFQRLHSREEFSGSGIGLAICKKIVERHGGRIWVESLPGRGSRFMFTIPDRGGESQWAGPTPESGSRS